MSDTPVEEVILNWTDLTGKKTGATSLGSNKFYKGQIFQEAGGGFKVVFNYGRVGQAGQTQTIPCKSLDLAKKALAKKIDEKVAKGYTRLDMRSEAEEKSKAASKGVAVDPAAPKQKAVRTREFHPEVENFLKLVYNATGQAVAAGLSSSAGATREAPLGNLSDRQLDKGADLLDEAEKQIKAGKTGKNDLVEITNEFLSNIPRNIDHARKGGKLDLSKILLNSDERIKEQREFISLLRDAFLQKEVFSKAAEVDDPTEVWYDGLKCDIEHVDPKSDFYKYVNNVFSKGQSPKNSNFHGRLKLCRVWKLEQQGRKPAFDQYVEAVAKKKGATGVVPGWHGTRTENLMGICKTGLLMPENLPKGVQITGRAFGLGIYHTPAWPDSGENVSVDEHGKKFTRHNGALKSMNYSSLRGAHYFANNTADRGYMFMEELALGVPEIALKACFNKPRPEQGCDYIYARAHLHQSLANDEVVTFSEAASRRVAVLEVMYK